MAGGSRLKFFLKCLSLLLGLRAPSGTDGNSDSSTARKPQNHGGAAWESHTQAHLTAVKSVFRDETATTGWKWRRCRSRNSEQRRRVSNKCRICSRGELASVVITLASHGCAVKALPSDREQTETIKGITIVKCLFCHKMSSTVSRDSHAPSNTFCQLVFQLSDE